VTTLVTLFIKKKEINIEKKKKKKK